LIDDGEELMTYLMSVVDCFFTELIEFAVILVVREYGIQFDELFEAFLR